MASLIPKSTAVTTSWVGGCFKDTKASAVTQSDGSVLLKFTANNAATLTCYDQYFLATVSGMQLLTIMTRGDKTVTWTPAAGSLESELWDLQTKGVRVFRFLTDTPTTLANAALTAELFYPMDTQGVDEASALKNIDFIERYTHFKMPARSDSDNAFIPEDQIKSGDFFGVMRLDGIDPMLAWAMGSTTGHVTTALWIDGELYVAESTVVDSYWPTNGVQKTPYRQWLDQANAAGYNVVFAPLTEKARSQYNEQAAIDFFKTVEGLDYGYKTLLWGWFDTPKDNLPCLPPDYKSNCIQFEFFEVLFGLIDKAAPELADEFVIEAWNLRLGTEGLRIADLYYTAYQQGLSAVDIPQIPEQDSWLYHTTRYGSPAIGKSMVCCVFVCNMWKAAGVFSDINSELNCGELTNWDDYSLTVLDSYTQILGSYTLTLNDFATKTFYPHMAEQCPSFAPDYYKPATC
jgi:hypothetical protein